MRHTYAVTLLHAMKNDGMIKLLCCASIAHWLLCIRTPGVCHTHPALVDRAQVRVEDLIRGSVLVCVTCGIIDVE